LVDRYNQKLYHITADGQGWEDSLAIAGSYAHVELIILTGSEYTGGEDVGNACVVGEETLFPEAS
jgi:hypothetical protein